MSRFYTLTQIKDVLKELEPIQSNLKELTEKTLPELEQDLKEAGAPWIEGP